MTPAFRFGVTQERNFLGNHWIWPKNINRLRVKNLFCLHFIKDRSNVISLGGVGLGKTRLAPALGYASCLKEIPYCSPSPLMSSTPLPQPKPPGARSWS